MISIADDSMLELQDSTIVMLHELRVGIHRLGYKCLTIAIPCYVVDDTQSLTKELYPYVAECLGRTERYAVERAIRMVILDAWKKRNPTIWEQYFPEQEKVPTNKQFLAVLAERLR